MFNAFSRLHYFFLDFYGYLFIFAISFFFFISRSYKIYKSSKTEREKQKSISILFAIFIGIAVFICFEGFFRYRYDESDSLGFLRTNMRWQQRHVVYNNFFYRDRDFTIQKKPGVTRIGVVGDSMTFGYGINNVGDRFTNILEQKLKAAGKNVEVYNLGRPGLDTCGEINEFNKIKFMPFDIMVWEFYPNDVQPCGDGRSTGSVILSHSDTRSGFIKFLSDKSFFFDYVYWRITATHKKVFTQLRIADLAQYTNKPIFDEEKQSMATLSVLLKGDEGNRKTIGVIFPFFFLIGPNYPAKNIHSMISQIMKNDGIDAVIDLLPDVEHLSQTQLLANQFDFHPSVFVHQIAAEKLFKVILPLLPQ